METKVQDQLVCYSWRCTIMITGPADTAGWCVRMLTNIIVTQYTLNDVSIMVWTKSYTQYKPLQQRQFICIVF